MQKIKAIPLGWLCFYKFFQIQNVCHENQKQDGIF